MSDNILTLRLRQQLIERDAGENPADPAGVVARLGAVQAQDYPGALWSVGLRTSPDAVVADVERSIAERSIVRTWPMRGTLHFVTPGDVRWMLGLLSERVLARAATRHAQLGLTDDVFDRAGLTFAEELTGGPPRTRKEMMRLLERGGIDPSGQRGYHILWTLALRGLICCGPMAGKQQTFVLLDEWIPRDGTPATDRAEALARLASRYFGAHGPATLADFAWWAGITRSDARIGLDGIADDLAALRADGTEYWLPKGHSTEIAAPPADARVHLLPGFDEYFLGYTDRTRQLGEHGSAYRAAVPANGMFPPTVVIGGRAAGTWKRTIGRAGVDVRVHPVRALTAGEQRALERAVESYGRFLGLPARVVG